MFWREPCRGWPCRAPAPAVYSWRCEPHRRSTMQNVAVWAKEQGDLCFTLVCGHQVQWVCRGQWGSTQALVEQGQATGQVQLKRCQRCFCAAIRKARQSMQLDLDQDGQTYLTLARDEHIVVKIGGAEVALIGGIVGAPGEGPLVQIMLQVTTGRLEMKHFTPSLGHEYLEVRVVPEETDEP